VGQGVRPNKSPINSNTFPNLKISKIIYNKSSVPTGYRVVL
jgi:hypothetical protein